MLIGSTQILGPVPARSLDPVLLALSQPPDMRGYVLLSARERAGPLDPAGGRSWDAIFLAGDAEPDCLRLSGTSRTILPFARAQQELRNAGNEGRMVHLFEAPEKLLREFLWIARSDPLLKVNLDTLDLRQIEALLAGSPVRQGLLERSDLTGDLPCFELAGISTLIEGLGIPFTLPHLQLGFAKGGMALYSLDPVMDGPASRAPVDGAAPDRPEEVRGRRGERTAQTRRPAKRPGGKRRASEPVSYPPKPLAAQHLQQDLEEGLNQDLQQGLNRDLQQGLQQDLGQGLRRNLQQDVQQDPGRGMQQQTEQGLHHDREQGLRRNLPQHLSRYLSEYLSRRQPAGNPTPQPEAPDDVVIIFQRLFRSFRKKGVDHLGGRWEDAFRSAVEKVRFLAPEFQADSLTPQTAPLIPDLILELIGAAPFLKRPRLREAGLLLIADIYDKHFDLLEARGLVDRVEQAYLRLKP